MESTIKSDDSIRRNNYYYAIAVYFVALAVVLMTYINLIFSSRRYKRDFKVDKEMFVSAVHDAIHDYLNSYMKVGSNDTVSVETPVSTVSQSVGDLVEVESVDYGFYISFRGRPFALIDGVEFTLGDFYKGGVIVGLTERRIYIRNDEKVLVIANQTKNRKVDEDNEIDERLVRRGKQGAARREPADAPNGTL